MLGAAAATALAAAAASALAASGAAPWSWAAASACTWAAFASLKGWRRLSRPEALQVAWGLTSAASLAALLASRPSFSGWEDVYLFCGADYAFCTPSFHWSPRGWQAAGALAAFGLSAALGAQRLLLQAAAGGLLPGEEVITAESFLAVGWRLVPSLLNRWESSFGAEASSVLFELPHFALELVVVLPVVRILASRLRVLSRPHALAPAANRGAGAGEAQQPRRPPFLVPDVLRRRWLDDPAQAALLPRLRRNLRPMAAVALVSALAAANALVIPLAFEAAVLRAPRARALLALEPELAALAEAGRRADLEEWRRRRAALAAGRDPDAGAAAAAAAPWGAPDGGAADALVPRHWLPSCLALNATPDGRPLDAARLRALLWAPGRRPPAAWLAAGGAAGGGAAAPELRFLRAAQAAYLRRAAPAAGGPPPPPPPRARLAPLYRALAQHGRELRRMADPGHRALVPAVEAGLGLMRLSCERWPPLVAAYVAYLLWGDPPAAAAAGARALSALCGAFRRGVLLAFPAVCWAFGAGWAFSALVSVIFWTAPASRALERLRAAATEVAPRAWRAASAAEVDRAGGQCSICWSEMAAAPAAAAEAPPQPAGAGRGRAGGGAGAGAAWALPACGHAFHRGCLREWLASCHAAGRAASCPMCNSSVPLVVRFRPALAVLAPGGGGGGGADDDGAMFRAAAGGGFGGGGGLGAGPIPGLDLVVQGIREDFEPRLVEEHVAWVEDAAAIPPPAPPPPPPPPAREAAAPDAAPPAPAGAGEADGGGREGPAAGVAAHPLDGLDGGGPAPAPAAGGGVGFFGRVFRRRRQRAP